MSINFNPEWQFKKTIGFRGWRIVAEMRRKDPVWGRLGGGWLWKLGILVGRTSVVIELFAMSVRIWRPEGSRKNGYKP